jgi:vancomycin resistance protein YoaR
MRIQKKAIYLYGSAGLVILIVCLILFVYGSQRTLPRGIKISGWNLTGMTITQLDLQLKETMALIAEQQVMFICNGIGCKKSSPVDERIQQAYWSSSKITLRNLAVNNNLSVIAASIHSLEEGIWYKRAWTRWRLTNTHYNLTLSFDESKLLEAIKHEWPRAYSYKPINAYRKIDSNDSIMIIPEINGYQVKIDELNRRLLKSLPSAESPWLLKLKQGIPLDLKVDLPLVIKKPSVTMVSLKAQGISRKISQFSTLLRTSASGRIHNVAVTAATIQNQLLAPGDVFDYSQIIRQTEKRFGYQEAPVIYNGKLVPGIGGGICQVSSTLYNAVLRAGLQIIERRNHSLPVSYVPLGQDATYATGYINFRFRNSSDHFLLIRTSIENNTLVIKLFGTIQQEKTYEITSQIVERIQPSTRYLLNSKLAPNEQQIVQQGKIGYIVETYRFQKHKGKITNRELVSRDTYPAQPTLVAVGEGQKVKVQPNTPPVLEDGVSGPVFGG